MATSFYLKKKRQDEAILSRLERRYDRDGSFLRQYAQDCLDITYLVKEGVIDREHGELLRERAKQKYEEAEAEKRRAKWLVVRDSKDYFLLRRVTFAIGFAGVMFFLFLTKACGAN